MDFLSGGHKVTRNKTSLALIFVLSLVAISPCLAISIEDQQDPKYCIVDTGQEKCYDNSREIREPSRDGPFYGQDAQNKGNKPSYRDNGDGTVTDLNTGLMWVRERGKKVTWKDAISGAPACRIGGYTDWRMPTIKELYSLMNFTGRQARTESESVPYIDTKYFGFKYGSGTGNERLIDCQDWSATEYLSTTMNNDASVFGVNFADGRIKGYPKQVRRREGAGDNRLYARYVRGNPEYGKNDFIDNGDGTVADRATGLVWSKGDSGTGMNWEQALKWVQKKNTEKYLGHDDWRLPNAKELQSIVDYSRCPDRTDSPSIAPFFECAQIKNEKGDRDYPFYWTGTTHLDNMGAVYVCFGRAMGFMEMPPGSGNYRCVDVHGAGAQRSDPKAGNPADFPKGRGPQGDVVRINNFVRLARDMTS